ncbi:MAG TPA: hypothetical protein VKS44_13975, partial [Candidatus Acidoferrales bacterium]|nr:hypothetical protein [Candidatus Acidoferrales bacterium]
QTLVSKIAVHRKSCSLQNFKGTRRGILPKRAEMSKGNRFELGAALPQKSTAFPHGKIRRSRRLCYADLRQAQPETCTVGGGIFSEWANVSCSNIWKAAPNRRRFPQDATASMPVENWSANRKSRLKLRHRVCVLTLWCEMVSAVLHRANGMRKMVMA